MLFIRFDINYKLFYIILPYLFKKIDRPALYFAPEEDCDDYIKLLLEAGASKEDCIKLLLEAGANINIVTDEVKNSCSLLHKINALLSSIFCDFSV